MSFRALKVDLIKKFRGLEQEGEGNREVLEG